MTRSAQRAARLAALFQDVNPPEIQGASLQGKTPQDIIQLLLVYGGKNPVHGILVDDQTARAYAFRSGWSLEASEYGGITFQKGNLTQEVAEKAGPVWRELGHHVEAQAAAFMRKEGIAHASLYLNAANPCYLGGQGCFYKLPEMLAEGARLNVYNKEGKLFAFTGIPDPEKEAHP